MRSSHKFGLRWAVAVCESPFRMRLLIEVLVISVLIYCGWDTPFKEWGNRATAVLQTRLHSERKTP
jgi:hypothetical protein